MVLQRYNKYLKSYSISAFFFVFILRNEGRWKKADGRGMMADGRGQMEEGGWMMEDVVSSMLL